MPIDIPPLTLSLLVFLKYLLFWFLTCLLNSTMLNLYVGSCCCWLLLWYRASEGMLFSLSYLSCFVGANGKLGFWLLLGSRASE
uniref:Uncharacterized protein n=1 Tax=Kalanchoe fedtschenkoi TaxID=63787 RepID=A0A7N0UKE8_KALFE